MRRKFSLNKRNAGYPLKVFNFVSKRFTLCAGDHLSETHERSEASCTFAPDYAAMLVGLPGCTVVFLGATLAGWTPTVVLQKNGDFQLIAADIYQFF